MWREEQREAKRNRTHAEKKKITQGAENNPFAMFYISKTNKTSNNNQKLKAKDDKTTKWKEKILIPGKKTKHHNNTNSGILICKEQSKEHWRKWY